VVLLLLENHSFDQMLGCLEGVDGVSATNVNYDADGTPYFQAVTTERQTRYDPKHELRFVAEQLSGNNGGFVKNFSTQYPDSTKEERQEIMGYYPKGFLPALHTLASEYTVCDRWFSSLPGPTWPNRFFALSGTSNGRARMPEGPSDPDLEGFFAQDQVTVFDRLSEAKRSWKVYFYDFPSSLLLTHQRRPENLQNYKLINSFYEDVRSESNVAEFIFIEPKYFGQDQNDDHPPHNIIKAEKLIADVYNALRTSPAWSSTVLVIYFDEHGGFYDHVVPPAAVPPDDQDKEYGFRQLGIRVPALIVSPWATKQVLHTQFDHTSVLKFLTDLWRLDRLGDRTSSANSIEEALNAPVLRLNTTPFIRVPYTDLIPEHPEMEKRDTSEHHSALRAFAHYLEKQAIDSLPGALSLVARGAGRWTLFKANVGEKLVAAGNILMHDLENFDKSKTEAVLSQVFKLLGHLPGPH